MTDLYRIKPLSMLGWWLACSFLVFPLTIFAVGITAMPIVFLVSLIPYGIINDFVSGVLGIVSIGLIGGIIGLSMAINQRWLLRSKLYWTADKWVRWTILGGAVGAYVAMGFTSLAETTFLPSYPETLYLFMMPIFITIVSAFQIISLRHAVKQSWLWSIGNLVAGVVFAGVIINNQPSYTNPNNELIMLMVGLLAIVALGLITGFVMLFLFENKLHPMRPADDKNPLPNPDPNATPSVWDNVV